MKKLIIIIAILFSLGIGAYADKSVYNTDSQSYQVSINKEIPNFQIVDKYLARGGQPSNLGLVILSKLGYKTVINLRTGDDGKKEAALVLLLGMNYYNIPMSPSHAPKKEDVEKIMSIISKEGINHVFIHCKEGADRTGVVVAAYRMSFYGWPSWMAAAEAKYYGLKWYQFGKKEFIKEWGN